MDFRILGPLEVRADGAPVPVGGAKPRALLAILLLRAGEVVSTDRLIDELWGERPPETAAKALQVHVSALRKALGAEVIETRAPGYALALGPHELDLDRFRALHDDARAQAASDPARARELLGEALALWRGAPLADFAYEPFAQAELGRLEDLRAAALEDRIESDLALGRHVAVVGELESLIARHPHRERLRAQLMLALYRSGRQAEALDAYQQARAALTGELGIDPGRELRELQQAILRQDPALDHRPAPAAAGPSDFVGRERELAELDAALADALAGRGRLVLIAGEPGIGKSRLADELMGRAAARGAEVLVGRCWEAGGAPAYWPWIQSLRGHVRAMETEALRAQLGSGAPDLAQLLPDLRARFPDIPEPPAPGSDSARFRLLESVAFFLRNAASVAPLALFLDDLHAADEPTLLLLRFVTGQLADSPILIVGAYRDTEVGPELGEALADLTRERAVQRLTLTGLSDADTSHLLGSTMGEAPPGELAAHVHAGTQGNPLFASEIGRLLATEGLREDTPDRLPIPAGIREAIGRRLQRQSERCQEVLTLASVVGREFDPDAIGRVGGLDDDELVAALDEAGVARLVEGVPEASGRLRFSHILVRDALYDDLSAARRVRLHRVIAEALEGLYGANLEPHLAELAHHYLEAGSAGADRAMEYSQRAGDRAAAQHGYEEAVRHYQSALGVLETAGSADASTTCDLLLSLGESLSRAGSDDESKRVLRRAAERAQETGRPEQLARAALEYGGRFAWARASTDPALVPLLEGALSAVGEGDSTTRVRLLARLAGATRDEPSIERRTRLADEAVAIADRLGDPATLGFALEGYWVAVEGPDNAGEGVDIGQRLIALGGQIGDRDLVFAGHDHRVHNFWQIADRTGLDVTLDAIGDLAEELGQPANRWHARSGRSMLALMEGRFEEAEELIDETLALGQRAQSWNAIVTHRLALFVLRRGQGRLAELEDTIRRSVHEYPALVRFRCALAHLYGELGRKDEARAAVAEMLALDLARNYRDAEWLFAMTLLTDPCAFAGDRAATEQLYALLVAYEHLYAQAPVEAEFGSVARGLGVLATTLRRFDDAERHFEVALATERRMRARPWLAHAQHDMGAMLLERDGEGDAERARALLEEATDTYRELGMGSWAARAAGLTVAGHG